MSSNSSHKKLEGFFSGKGFYIVLFLCAAVIGVSAWMMATGDETMYNSGNNRNIGIENRKVETVILPPSTQKDTSDTLANSGVPAADQQEASLPAADAEAVESGDATEVWREGDVMEVTAPLYIWPVQGELERSHDLENLSYDATLKDWRTHSGIDIAAELGAEVSASRSGSVESIEADELYGTVLTLNHGDGSSSIYANLAAETAVNVGDWVEPGDTVGYVGDTAICEISQNSHLHFAMTIDQESVNPLNYLPA